MTPTIDDEWVRAYVGDLREVLAQLPEGSAHACVTSPPYWGLRDYGLPPAAWGGDPAHEHAWVQGEVRRETRGTEGSTLQGSLQPEARRFDRGGHDCACGAWLGQLGLEPTPDLYVAHLVEAFRAVRRVLRPDGTLWLVLGDSYADRANRRSDGVSFRQDRADVVPAKVNALGGALGLKAKDLVGIPWMVAFALRADGWWLRTDVVWHKPNGMPDSADDRPARSHEFVFMLTRSERYYYDSEAVAEPAVTAREARWDPGTGGMGGGFSHAGEGRSTRRFRQPRVGRKQDAVEVPEGSSMGNRYAGLNDRYDYANPPQTRSRRDVWTVATRPYPGLHFAVFPEALVEPCVLASTSERGACPQCGAPWRRIWVETGHVNAREEAHVPDNSASRTDSTGWRPTRAPTDEFEPTCAHGCDPAPATVLDPFAGSGTVGQVAQRLSRRAILVDLNPGYAAQQLARNAQRPFGL